MFGHQKLEIFEQKQVISISLYCKNNSSLVMLQKLMSHMLD